MVAPLAPLPVGDVWLGNALVVHWGGVCPSTHLNEPRVFGFISVGTSSFDYINNCPVVVSPWANKDLASPHGSQGPHATSGAVGSKVLVDVSHDTTVCCVTCGYVPLCADHSMEGSVNSCAYHGAAPWAGERYAIVLQWLQHRLPP